MAKVTSARDRSKRTRTKPITSSQRRPSRQRNSTAQVSSSESRPSDGNARVTRNQDARRPPSGAGRVDNTNVGPQSTGRSLPPEGGTNAGSPRSRNQQAWTRDRGARTQLRRGMTNLARGAARMAGVDRYSQASRKAETAAAGSQGDGVREGRPRPEITRSSSGSATDGRIERVNVRDVTNQPRGTRPRLPGGRESLPEGRRGGDVRPSRGGAVANIPEPRPRPGGYTVVDESPRLPEGKKGGDLATQGGESGSSSRPKRLPPDSRGGSRIGNSSEPWGDRPQRGNSPRVSSTKALPPGQRGGELAKTASNRPSGGSSSGAARAAGGAGRFLGGAATVLGIASTAQSILNPKDNIGLDLKNLGNAVYNATTPKGGTKKRYEGDNERVRRMNAKVDAENKATWRGFQNTGPAIPQRLKNRPTRSEAPERPRNSGGGSSGGYTPASTQRPAAEAPSRQSERPTRSSSSEGGKASRWEDFNPGRGTSRTNNPLIKNDEYLMGKIKQREQSAAKDVGSKGFQIKDNLAGDLKIPDGTEAASKGTTNRTKEAYSSSDLRTPRLNYDNLSEKEKKRVRDRYYN